MNLRPIDSSNISGASYNPNAGTLTIQFHSGGVYEYHGVAPEIAEKFFDADSKGGFFHEHIKSNYSFKKVGGN